MEEWREVEGYPYEVSNLGRVRRAGWLLKPQVRPKMEYQYVNLWRNGKMKAHYIHRLVAKAFLGPEPLEKPLVLHGPNGVTDNSVGNLRWGSNSDNMLDRQRDGTDPERNKTHCPRNHEYTEENTLLENQGRRRKCRTCHNERRRKR